MPETEGCSVAPSAARAAGSAIVAPRSTLVADLRALLGQASLHRRVPGPLEPNLHVLGRLVPLDLPPSVGQQVLQASGRCLAQGIAARHLDVKALVDDLSVVGHRGTG